MELEFFNFLKYKVKSLDFTLFQGFIKLVIELLS